MQEVTVTYMIPDFAGDPSQDVSVYSIGGQLQKAILAGDGQAINVALIRWADQFNGQVDLEQRRKAFADRCEVILSEDLLPKVTTTGFKAVKKSKWTGPTARDGEKCESSYCRFAAKYQLPDAPEGVEAWNVRHQACLKHAVAVLRSYARDQVINENPNQKRVFLGRYEDSRLDRIVTERLKSL